jgi:diphthamide biosynthesis protein 3
VQTRLVFNYGGGQLDFEDEKPEDDEGKSSESEHEQDEDSGSEGDQFEDAMEKLVISDTPAIPPSP